MLQTPHFLEHLQFLFQLLLYHCLVWLMQKGFENLFNYSPAVKKNKYHDRALHPQEQADKFKIITV